MENGLRHLQNNGQILWRFNASKAPHEAGTWERLVKSTKHILLKICRNALLNYVAFQTVLKETQALLNDRPLLQLSSDALNVLTPSMLIYGKSLLPYRDNFAQSNLKGQENAKIRWEHHAQVMDYLYAVWRKEYRLSLQQKAKWFTALPCIKVGDVVVLYEEKVKRGYWILARVCQIFPSRYGSIRKVEVSVLRFDDKGKPMRPLIPEWSVRQLCPLELTEEPKQAQKVREAADAQKNMKAGRIPPS